MRYSAAVLLFLTTGGAGASSLVALEPAKAGLSPSMVVLANGQPTRPSRSVVTLDEALPAVSNEKLSAIGTHPKLGPGETPVLIKGGLTAQPAGRK